MMAVQYESLRNPVGHPARRAVRADRRGHRPARDGAAAVDAGLARRHHADRHRRQQRHRAGRVHRAAARRGAALVDAVIEAARLRLRPIMMTTLTTVGRHVAARARHRRGLRDAAPARGVHGLRAGVLDVRQPAADSRDLPGRAAARRARRGRGARAGGAGDGDAEPSGTVNGPLALDGDAQAAAALRVVVPQGVVLGAAVVPERHRAGLPAEAALQFRRLHQAKEHLQHCVALVLFELQDAAREDAIDEQRLAPADRMRADHRMLGRGIRRRLLHPLVATAIRGLAVVQRGHAFQHALHRRRERLVGGVHAGEQRVAALRAAPRACREWCRAAARGRRTRRSASLRRRCACCRRRRRSP